MKVPSLRKTVKIKFSSLRNEIGSSGGVIFDVDTDVERYCYRVKTKSGWKWQIRGLRNLIKWDFFAEQDQEILDEYEKDVGFEIIT